MLRQYSWKEKKAVMKVKTKTTAEVKGAVLLHMKCFRSSIAGGSLCNIRVSVGAGKEKEKLSDRL